MSRKMIYIPLLFAAAVFATNLVSQDIDYHTLAHNVISASAQVKPGEVVVISGGKHTIDFVEELAVETEKAGGFSVPILGSDAMERALAFDVPEQYLSQPPQFFVDWLKSINVFINLPGVEDPRLFAQAPPARLARMGQASKIVADALNASHARTVNLIYPSRHEAEAAHIDFSTYSKMEWEAMSRDYRPIAEQGERLKKILESGKHVKITSPKGTNLTFALGSRPVSLETGLPRAGMANEKIYGSRIVNLPGGRIMVAPVETSANGKVVVAKDDCRSDVVNNASFDFKDGILTNYKADSNADCLNQILAGYTGPKNRFGYIRIGLNPSEKVLEEGEARYWPSFAAGMVWIGVGNNTVFGGRNNDTAGGYSFPITHATVEVDGKVIIRDGQLVM